MSGGRFARDEPHGDDLRRAIEVSEASSSPQRGSGVRHIRGIAMPGTFIEKRVPHGKGQALEGWVATKVKAPAGVPAEYPNEIRRDREVLVLATATAETVDIMVW